MGPVKINGELSNPIKYNDNHYLKNPTNFLNKAMILRMFQS